MKYSKHLIILLGLFILYLCRLISVEGYSWNNYVQKIVSWTTRSCCTMLYWSKNLVGLHWWHSYLLYNMACLICCSSAAFVDRIFSTGQHFFVYRTLRHSFTEIHGLVILHKRTTNCSIHSKSSSLIQEATGSRK